ncbi:MAG: copper transporter [Sciscionella sp.]|nr:copper transporter [Sciscionella sp.]
MISLRYHIVTIAAVFIALALGVVLGSTSLSSTLLSGLTGQKDQLGRQVSDLQTQRNALNAKLANDDKFAKSIGPTAVRGTLAKRTVALITTADARPADRDALLSLIKDSGATVTAQVQLTDAFTDSNKADQLRDLVTRSIPAGVQLPTASDPGTLAGGLMGPLLLLNKQNNHPQASHAEISAAMSALSDGGFVKTTGNVEPAQLAIVLTGGAQQGTGAGDKASTLGRFATQVQRSGAGTVLAGDAGSADGDGAIGVVRADTSASSVLSTVDDADSPAGQTVTMLALVEQLNGKAGQYGIAGNAQAPMPTSNAG